MAVIDSEMLADNAVLIGLVSRTELSQARQDAEDGSGEALARAMMRKGYLTSWQRDKLLKGDTSGFFYGPAKVLFHLAEGTFARVYRGSRMPGNESVAIKVLRRRFATEPAAVARFNQEAESGQKLNHPNIARIYEHGEQDKNYYMIMEYVEGSNLRDFLKIRKTISTADALPMIVGLAKGLQYSIENGVTHRDIKATNVLIGSKGEAKLVDFGLAEIDTGDFSAGAAQGVRTVDYSALERGCGSQKGDPRSDIYFLGCVFYQMLTGTPPMAETETSDQLAKMLKRSFSAIKPLSEHRLAPPAELANIIEKMMKMDLRARYQNMDEVVKDLVAFQESYTGSPAGKVAVPIGQGAGVIKPKEKRKAAMGTVEDLFEQAFGYLPEPEGPRQVLCVEAQESIREAFRKAFTKMGYEVMLVGDATHAAERFRESPPDLLVFDADGLGEEALPAYVEMHKKAHEDRHELKVLLLLGPRQEEFAQKLPSDDRILILHKPLKMKDVQEAMTQLVPANG
jgi:tRNA A-37 threonylcarbamoyl transferase component Bud32/CheY-like chemotaxis protein